MSEPATQIFEVVIECDDRQFTIYTEALTLAEAASLAALAVSRRVDKAVDVLRAKQHDRPVAVLVRHDREPLQVLEYGRQRRVPCFVGLKATDDPQQRTFDEFLRRAESSE